MKTILLLTMLTAGTFAQARPCTQVDKATIKTGLTKMKKSTNEEVREKAQYAASLFVNALCSTQPTLVMNGNRYNLLTTTHQIQIEMVDTSISKLEIQRIRN